MGVQADVHTPEKGFGQIIARCKPRLGVITHGPCAWDLMIAQYSDFTMDHVPPEWKEWPATRSHAGGSR